MPQRNLGVCQCAKLGIDCIHCGFNDRTHTWNSEHPVYKTIEVRFDRGEYLENRLTSIWWQLAEQPTQLIKFRRSFGYSGHSGLGGSFVLDAGWRRIQVIDSSRGEVADIDIALL